MLTSGCSGTAGRTRRPFPHLAPQADQFPRPLPDDDRDAPPRLLFRRLPPRGHRRHRARTGNDDRDEGARRTGRWESVRRSDDEQDDAVQRRDAGRPERQVLFVRRVLRTELVERVPVPMGRRVRARRCVRAGEMFVLATATLAAAERCVFCRLGAQARTTAWSVWIRPSGANTGRRSRTSTIWVSSATTDHRVIFALPSPKG